MFTYQRDSVKSQIAQFWWLAPLSFGGSLLDIAPTVLTLFDLPVGRDMDGRPLVSIYEYPPAVRWIDSWDRVPGDAARVDAAPVAGGAATAAAVIRQLADLGYIDELPADQHDALEETAREERWNLARSLVDAGQLEEAAGLVTELWERWPDEVRFGMALFQYQLELGQILEARSTLLLLDERKTAAMARASEKLAQKFTELRATQGLPPAGEGQLDKGIDPQAVSVADHILIKRLKARSARNPDTFAFLEGKLLAAERRFPEALAAFERAKGVQASLRPTLILERAEVLLKMRKLSAATVEFQRVLEADPLNLAAQYGLARAAMAGQDAPRAAEAAKGAIGIRYHFPRAHLLAGVALWRAGELAEAERFLRSAVELQPVFPAAQRMLGAFLGRIRGDLSAAIHHRSMAIESRNLLRQVRAGVGPEGRHPLEIQTVPGSGPQLVEPQRLLTAPQEECVVVVTGLPRSGTSMMMQMLSAGGIDILRDDRRPADASNPRGYLEYEPVKRLGRDASWVGQARGKGVKIVSPLVRSLPRDESAAPYLVIQVRRPLTEVVASQREMLARLGRDTPAVPDEVIREGFAQQLVLTQTFLDHLVATGRGRVIDIDYHQALADPVGTATRLAEFLGGSFDTPRAAAAVERSLHRVAGR